MTMGPAVHSFGYGLEFLCEQVADVPEGKMAVQAEGVVNHPAWTIGHVLNACQMLGGVIGVEEWLPDGWAQRFGYGSKPVNNSGVCPSKDELLALVRETRERITQAVEGLDEAFLDSPFPDPSYRDVFPTIRHFLTQVLVGHTSFHVGQLSVWRKAMNLPPMRRSFE